MRASRLAVSLGLLFWTAPLAAQGGRPLRVNGAQDLSFGTVLPGVPRSIPRTDPANCGRFDIRGARLSEVQFTFTLPTSMTGPGGAAMPITFGGNDAGFSLFAVPGAAIGFDPRLNYLNRLSGNGRAYVFLGGTAAPAVGQRAGNYTATVTLTVAYTGL